jgi:hypothetical protein
MECNRELKVLSQFRPNLTLSLSKAFNKASPVNSKYEYFAARSWFISSIFNTRFVHYHIFKLMIYMSNIG